jgi:hypothetical protein
VSFFSIALDKCGICIIHFDHHCAYINNCIGRRNYPVFIVMTWAIFRFYISQLVGSFQVLFGPADTAAAAAAGVAASGAAAAAGAAEGGGVAAIHFLTHPLIAIGLLLQV